MPVCQFLEHQITDSDHTLSGLSGPIRQNIKTPNKYSVVVVFKKSELIRTILL